MFACLRPRRSPTFRRSLPKETESCECKHIRTKYLRDISTDGWLHFTAAASIAAGGCGQSDVAKPRKHLPVIRLSSKLTVVLTEMLGVLRHRLHILRFERIGTPFLIPPSQVKNKFFHSEFKPINIHRAGVRLQKRASGARQILA